MNTLHICKFDRSVLSSLGYSCNSQNNLSLYVTWAETPLSYIHNLFSLINDDDALNANISAARDFYNFLVCLTVFCEMTSLVTIVIHNSRIRVSLVAARDSVIRFLIMNYGGLLKQLHTEFSLNLFLRRLIAMLRMLWLSGSSDNRACRKERYVVDSVSNILVIISMVATCTHFLWALALLFLKYVSLKQYVYS